jgi:hypothetical protein
MAEDVNAPAQPSEISVFYFNGFTISFGTSDITIILKRDEDDVLRLKSSYTTAKTFAAGLSSTIERFEKVTDHNVMTIFDVAKKMQEAHEKEKTQS